MAFSKVILNGSTLMDVTDTTAVATDVASGKYFYGADGVKTLGSAAVVVGGLEYEMGIYTPTSDTYRPTIEFVNTHSSAPTVAIMIDVTGIDDTTSNTNYACAVINFHAFGSAVPSDSSANLRYGVVGYIYRNTSSPSQSAAGITDLNGNSSSSYMGYWFTSSEFYPSTTSTTRYWRTGRTYKWIAIWTPTT